LSCDIRMILTQTGLFIKRNIEANLLLETFSY